MIPYKNLNGNSSVLSYQMTADSIHVVFSSGAQRNYLYDSSRPGPEVVKKMKELAEAGRGLGSYIGLVVKGNYARKW